MIGYFSDTDLALDKFFEEMTAIGIFDVNPFRLNRVGPNVVLVFSGNAALSDKVDRFILSMIGLIH